MPRIDCYVSNADDGEVWIIEQSMLKGLEAMMQDLQVFFLLICI